MQGAACRTLKGRFRDWWVNAYELQMWLVCQTWCVVGLCLKFTYVSVFNLLVPWCVHANWTLIWYRTHIGPGQHTGWRVDDDIIKFSLCTNLLGLIHWIFIPSLFYQMFVWRTSFILSFCVKPNKLIIIHWEWNAEKERSRQKWMQFIEMYTISHLKIW